MTSFRLYLTGYVPNSRSWGRPHAYLPGRQVFFWNFRLFFHRFLGEPIHVTSNRGGIKLLRQVVSKGYGHGRHNGRRHNRRGYGRDSPISRSQDPRATRNGNARANAIFCLRRGTSPTFPIAVHPSSVQVVQSTDYTVSSLYIVVAVIYTGLILIILDDPVASYRMQLSEFPINSSTGEVTNLTTDTHTVTAHYYYPPRD